MMRELRRVTDNCWIGGVCAGIAKFVGIEAWIVRAIFVILGECLLPVYAILWIFMPEEGDDG